jgi:cellulose synthase/poly-beta-1,6-N-acetylglucosamine synthase-like glycosyltransferase
MSDRTADHHAPRTRREIAVTHAAIYLTLIASLVSLGGIALSLQENIVSRRWGAGLAQAIFLAIVGFLIYGGLVYQLARLGHLRRLLAHQPAGEEEIRCFFHSRTVPAVTILVPSYREDPRVVRRALLSAALQDYPNRRLVLLIDDPPHPTQPADGELLGAARTLPGEVQETLRKPAEHFADALDALRDRIVHGPLDHPEEIQRQADLCRDAATWFEEQEAGYPIADHADELFVELTFGRPAREYREKAERWSQEPARPGWPQAQDLLEECSRVAARFRLDMTSFERKRFVNLSHEPNKAMNLNSYIALLGRNWQVVNAGAELFLEPAGPEGGDLSVPDADYVLMLDADSVISPEYTLRLSHVLAQPGHERMAVVQTPYSAFPNAPEALERIAGATTDIQYIIHQGFTSYGATFWVGANALARKTALEDIAEAGSERGYPIWRFIQDRTVIEDTESTVDLIARGWRVHNYPERLAFSATPRDFGSLLIQRRRWANGGLLILPKLVRHLTRSRSISSALREGFMRCHYLASLAVVNAGLLLILTLSFEDGLRSLWLPLTAAPYYALYARDLRRCGYRLTDVFRVFALNLMLIPVHLGGVFLSLRQALTGKKSPFGRTPKIQGRTAAPPLYLIVEYAILAGWVAGAVFEFLHHRPLHAWFALGNAAFLAYAILCFIGLRESWSDFATATGIGAVGAGPSSARSSSVKSSTTVTTDT